MKSRTSFIALNILAVVLSLLTGLKIMPGPEIAGVSIAFYTLFILPGVLLSWLLFDSIGISVEGVCRVFFSGLVFMSFLVMLGLVPGISYPAVAVIGSGINIALLLWTRRRGATTTRSSSNSLAERLREGAGGGERGGRLLLVLLIFASFFVFFYGTGELGINSDSLDHISFIARSIDSGEIFPHDSFYKGGDGASFDPRKGLWHPVLSLWAYQSDVNPVFLWRVLPCFLAFFALASFYFFAIEILGSVSLALLAALFLLFFFKGEGIGWLLKIGYGQNVAQMVLWASVAYLIRFYRLKEIRWAALFFFLAVIGSAFHIIFPLLLAVISAGLFIYVTFTGSGREWKYRFWISIPIQIAAVAAPLAVRAQQSLARFNSIHTHRQGMMILSKQLAIVDPAEIVLKVGLVLFYALPLSPFIFLISSDRRRRNLVGILFLLPAILVLNPFSATLLEKYLGYLHLRLLYAAPLNCLLAVGVIGLFRILLFGKTALAPTGDTSEPRHSSGWRGSNKSPNGPKSLRRRTLKVRMAPLGSNLAKRLAAAAAMAVFIFYPLRFAAIALKGSVSHILQEKRGLDHGYGVLFEALERKIPGHSVIVSDPQTSYVLSAYTDHFIVVTLNQHCSPTDTMAVARLKAVRDIFSPAVPLSESFGWLKEQGADYILLNRDLHGMVDFFTPPVPGEFPLAYNKLKSCDLLLNEVLEVNGFFLFELEKGIYSSGVDSACSQKLASTLPCDAQAGFDYAPESSGMRGEETYAGNHADSGGSPFNRPLILDKGIEAGYGIVIESLALESDKFHAGDTLRGWFCWKIEEEIPFGLPLGWTVRLDTDFPKGAFYRQWYSKQYRRRMEKRNFTFYRLTRAGRLVSGFVFPDQWEAGKRVRQDFSIVLSRWLAPGTYDMRLKVRKLTYLTNRRISDYLRNEDSLHGDLLARIHIEESSGESESEH